MKRLSLLLLLCVATSAFANGRHIVAFNGGVPAGFADAVAAKGGAVVFEHKILAVVSGLDDAAAAEIGALRGVAEIQADEEFELDASAAMEATTDVADADAKLISADSPTNPAAGVFYSMQWNMPAIGANVAWAAGRLGSSQVSVAILDSGIDRQASPHVDLAGLVDYSRGAAFATDSAVCVSPGMNPGPMDDLHFHGTHVASTVSSNGWGAAGVASRVRLIPVKVLGLTAASGCTNASGSTAGVLAGVLFAADAGADVANMSLGSSFAKTAAGRFLGMVNSVFTYAARQGMVVVVSAGNAGADLDHDGNGYKAYCSAPTTVCVSATGPVSTQDIYYGPWTDIDALAYYSNYGRSAINVAAPGGNSGAYVWAACSRGRASCYNRQTVVGSIGTSMAAPHVSGLAALIVGEVGADNPAKVKAILQQSADDLGQPGTDAAYGKGRINVPRALGLQ